MKKIGFRIKVGFIVLLCLIVIIIITLRLIQLQIFQYKYRKEEAEKQYRSEFIVKAKRGKIVTKDGEILVRDVENYDLSFDPTLIEDKNIDKLMEIFSKNISDFDREKVKLEIIDKKKQSKRYLKFEYNIGYNEKKKIKEELEKERGLKAGVFFETNFNRESIKNNVFQEMVGFINAEGKGAYGLEKTYDKELTGVDGLIEGFRSLHKFSPSPIFKNKREAISVENGKNLILNIDSVLQYTLDDELKKAYEQYSAESTMGILMEVETGKIIAMSSYPKATNNSDVKNRPITDLFEPGSIFKPITVAIGLQTGAITENSIIESSGTIKVANRTIRDHDSSTTGSLTLEKLIANSGNVGMVKIAQKIKTSEFHEYLKNIGLGEKTGIDTYSELTKKLISQESMTEVRKSNIAFGQGISMTQLQMLVALNTVINNGKLVKPYIVDRIEDEDGKIIKQNSPTILRTIFNENVSRLNRKYMEAVVKKGTGKGVSIEGYSIGGKTGTAQKAGNKGYEVGKYFSSFFAFFPVENPKYAILITINEPKGSYYGAAVALPSVKVVLEKLIKYKGIDPKGLVEKEVPKTIAVLPIKKDLARIKEEFNMGIMPDLQGISLREFLSVFPANKYPKYKIVGRGEVKGQAPKIGTKITKDGEITVIFE